MPDDDQKTPVELICEATDRKCCPRCRCCEMFWEDCEQCGGEGESEPGELYSEDPMYYDEEDTRPCDACCGEGGHWYCSCNEHGKHEQTGEGGGSPDAACSASGDDDPVKTPFCRCGYCGYLPDYRVDLLQRPQCPVCRRTGTLARWRRWAPAQISVCPKANDWARRVAEGLKLCWPIGPERGADG